MHEAQLAPAALIDIYCGDSQEGPVIPFAAWYPSSKTGLVFCTHLRTGKGSFAPLARRDTRLYVRRSTAWEQKQASQTRLGQVGSLNLWELLHTPNSLHYSALQNLAHDQAESREREGGIRSEQFVRVGCPESVHRVTAIGRTDYGTLIDSIRLHLMILNMLQCRFAVAVDRLSHARCICSWRED